MVAISLEPLNLFAASLPRGGSSRGLGGSGGRGSAAAGYRRLLEYAESKGYSGPSQGDNDVKLELYTLCTGGWVRGVCVVVVVVVVVVVGGWGGGR